MLEYNEKDNNMGLKNVKTIKSQNDLYLKLTSIKFGMIQNFKNQKSKENRKF